MGGALPRRMIGYMTAELAEQLTTLTAKQRASIDRIVQHVYIENRPMRDLLHGDNRIAAENAYYRKPKFDDDGQLVKKGGWHHDPVFQATLKEAARLALLARTREELHAIAESKRRARLATGDVVDAAIEIAVDLVVARDDEGQPILDPETEKPIMVRRAQDKDRIAAASLILKYAEVDEKAQNAAGEATEADDWWGAADEPA